MEMPCLPLESRPNLANTRMQTHMQNKYQTKRMV